METYKVFFEREYTALVRFAYLLCGDAAEAEEIAQEAMARTCERWDPGRARDRPNNGTGIFCPFDDGSEAILLIGYPDGGRVSIEIHLKGCQMVSNGWLTARTTPGSRMALEALLGVPFGPS